ncbi:hypothetical protein DCM90_02680 [Levilactobacillus bambusae]|uniref:Uncharacterized protein n=2 Tax=Levilactobacillus bambusae TaxID=2024736 RepID=A0A2V1N3X5_9LACO|nr:hypothetical protein DCM90_02680 [Levilactobacillus bambusae]
MRQKYNLPDYTTHQTATNLLHHNQYMGLVKGTDVHNGGVGAQSTEGSVNTGDYYATFFTYDSNQTMQSKKYVDLSNGSFYVQRF